MLAQAEEVILVLDDKEDRQMAVSSFLSKKGYKVSTARTDREAFERLNEGVAPSVVTDFRAPRVTELDSLKRIKDYCPDTRVVLVADDEMLERAVQAMREGSVDGLLGCYSLERLEHSVRKVIQLVPRAGNPERPIITGSRNMREILGTAGRVAKSSATVLIQGETGTGKELLARYVHNRSPRRLLPFVAVNCAALPEQLMESELFGHEKGAFTGAMERRRGKFEMAQGGTLLLDEIGELAPVAQAKLLRVLQEKEVDRVGGKEPVPVDVRVIATTNRDLKKEVTAGRFREDLYYRLNVVSLTIPPLRERVEDIPLLLNYFIRKHCTANGMDELPLDEAARGFLTNQYWNGNVRELENTTEKAVLQAEGGRLLQEHFFTDAQTVQAGPAVADGSFKDMERRLIYKALEDAGGNKTQAARKLGLTARTIRNKLKSYENSSQLSTR